MDAAELAREVKEAGLDIPVVLLAYDGGELAEFMAHHDTSALERVFLWQGDSAHPAGHHQVHGGQAQRRLRHGRGRGAGHPPDRGQHPLLLVVPAHDLHRDHQPLAERSSPRASTWPTRSCACGPAPRSCCARPSRRPGSTSPPTRRTCWASSPTSSSPTRASSTPRPACEFARGGQGGLAGHPRRCCSRAGRRARRWPARWAPTSCSRARPRCCSDLRSFMIEQLRLRRLRLPAARRHRGRPGRRTCKSLLEMLQHRARRESITYHAERNDFSRWLKARTEFAPGPPSAPPHSCRTSQAPRTSGRDLIEADRRLPARADPGARSSDFDPATFDPDEQLLPHRRRARSGARPGRWPSCATCCATSHVITTGSPGCRSPCRRRGPGHRRLRPLPGRATTCASFAMHSDRRRGDRAGASWRPRFPHGRRWRPGRLPRAWSHYPLAVRSSSLLEDSQYQPLAGVYDTYMLPNNHPDDDRAAATSSSAAVKRVYASTFSQLRQELLQGHAATASRRRRWR